MSEDAATRLRRLRLRSRYRGIREMDLLLGAYAEAALAALDPASLDAYEALLEESDHDLLAWITGQAAAPAAHEAAIARIARDAPPALRGPSSGPA